MTNLQEWNLHFKRVFSIKRILTPISVEVVRYPDLLDSNDCGWIVQMIYIFGIRVYESKTYRLSMLNGLENKL